MKNIKITISYTGTNFHGYQAQPGLRTVEACLSQAIDRVMKKPVKLISAGRTDAGVHAQGQVANFYSDTKIDIGNLPRVINYHLPEDLSISKAELVGDDFHSRFGAKSKHYRYLILNRRNRSGLYANRMAHEAYPLDEKKMQRALLRLVGQHDFSAFIGRDSGPVNPVRTLDKIQLIRKGDIIQVDFYAQSFLKNQIRIIMGTAMEIGRGLKDEEALYRATLRGRRQDLGHTAQACGLYLMDISYK